VLIDRREHFKVIAELYHKYEKFNEVRIPSYHTRDIGKAKQQGLKHIQKEFRVSGDKEKRCAFPGRKILAY